MTYFEEVKLESIYKGGYEKQYGRSKHCTYEEAAIDYDRDEYRNEGNSSNYFLGHSLHFG